MTLEKVSSVIDMYEGILIKATANTGVRYWAEEHALEMIPQMRQFISEGRTDKVMRWLGFIQGILWVNRYYSIEQLKEHNMPNKDGE